MRWAYLLLTLISFQSLGQVLELYKDPNRFIYNYTPEKVERNNSRTLIWEEDFANGLAGNNGSGSWEVFGPDSLIWKHDFWGTSGEWSASTPSPNTTTVSNGFMLFDADSANFPLSPNYVNLNASLMSPRIDLSGQSSAVLSFEHWFRHCCSGTAFDIELDVSIDNGVTWTTYNLDSNISQSTSPANPTLVELNLTNLIANEDSVRLRFNWINSSHYFWVIDDIRIEEAPPYDLKLENFVWETVDTTWGGRGIPYTVYPYQKDMKFSADIINISNNTISCQLLLEITSYSGTDSILGNVSTIQPGQTLNDYVLFSSTISIAHFKLSVLYDSLTLDNTPFNNYDTVSFSSDSWSLFQVFDGYSKNEYFSGPGLWGGTDSTGHPAPYTLVTAFKIDEYSPFCGIQIDLDTNLTEIGASYTVDVYEFYPPNGYYLVYQSSLGIVNQNLFDWGGTIYQSFNNSLLLPNSHTTYYVGLTSYGDSSIVIKSEGRTPALEQQNIIIDYQNDIYALNYVPSIRVGMEWHVCSGSTNDITSVEINLHPNPTSNQLYVDLESIPQSYQILDLNGKLIISKHLNEPEFTIDVQSLPKGMYILQIQTEDGMGQEKFVVE